MNDAVSGYAVGRFAGKAAGRAESDAEHRRTIDVQTMAIDQLRDHANLIFRHLETKIEDVGFALAWKHGLGVLLSGIRGEASAILSATNNSGSISASEIEGLAPLFIERRFETREQRKLGNAKIKAAAIAYVRSDEGQENIFTNAPLSKADRARVSDRIFARIEREL